MFYGNTVIENLFLFNIVTNKTEIGCIYDKNTYVHDTYFIQNIKAPIISGFVFVGSKSVCGLTSVGNCAML